MSFLFSNRPYNALFAIWLFINRVGVSAFMLTHGYPKLLMLLDGRAESFPDPLGVGSLTSLILAIVTEVVASVFLILGLFSRFSAFALFITMAVAVFIVHAGDPFGTLEKALLYLFIYLNIIVFGPGKFSIDAVLSKR
ncbi:MAG: DoxX family protein [Bacteroidales bacterium]|jgi:putative oxidoreductase|nr:DoxX family protein [Bacteroidales bacterium]